MKVGIDPSTLPPLSPPPFVAPPVIAPPVMATFIQPNECFICLQQDTTDKRPIVPLCGIIVCGASSAANPTKQSHRCNATVHPRCVEQWLNQTPRCPMCRSLVSAPYSTSNDTTSSNDTESRRSDHVIYLSVHPAPTSDQMSDPTNSRRRTVDADTYTHDEVNRAIATMVSMICGATCFLTIGLVIMYLLTKP